MIYFAFFLGVLGGIIAPITFFHLPALGIICHIGYGPLVYSEQLIQEMEDEEDEDF